MRSVQRFPRSATTISPTRRNAFPDRRDEVLANTGFPENEQQREGTHSYFGRARRRRRRSLPAGEGAPLFSSTSTSNER